MAKKRFAPRWTPQKAKRRSAILLNRVDAMLIELAGLYGDEDQYICDRVDDFRKEIEGIREEISYATERLLGNEVEG